jgi:DNA-directed RNA polymerase specialized sigma24 family protein
MDKKTEDLRDIFLDIADETTVTEQQEDPRGSLTDGTTSAERIRDIIAEMREKYDFSTSLSDDQLVTVVEFVYQDASDGDIAAELECSEREVFLARLDLHLLRDSDLSVSFDRDELQNMLVDGLDIDEIAAQIDVSESTVRRYRQILEARNEARRIDDRFRNEFEEALLESELRDRLTIDINEDGLEEAIDGMETDVSF